MHLSVLLFLSNLFSTDMVLIVIVALVLFGGDKLPEIVRALGKGMRDFKEASEGVKREINAQIYSYEEKKQEQKLDELALKNQQETQNQLTSGNVSEPAVPNTIPFSEGTYNENPVQTEEHVNAGAEPGDESHHEVSHEENGPPAKV